MYLSKNSFKVTEKEKTNIYQTAECGIRPTCIWNQLNIERRVAERFVWRFSIRFSKAHNLLNSERRLRSSATFAKRQFTFPLLQSDLHIYIHLTQIRNKQLLILFLSRILLKMCACSNAKRQEGQDCSVSGFQQLN